MPHLGQGEVVGHLIGDHGGVRPGPHTNAAATSRVSTRASTRPMAAGWPSWSASEADPDGFGDAVDCDVADARQGVGDQVTRCAAVPRAGAEENVDIVGLVHPHPDPDGQQATVGRMSFGRTSTAFGTRRRGFSSCRCLPPLAAARCRPSEPRSTAHSTASTPSGRNSTHVLSEALVSFGAASGRQRPAAEGSATLTRPTCARPVLA